MADNTADNVANNIITEMVSFRANGDNAPGYLARPSGDEPHPGVVVIQEWWGLNSQIKGVADRFAQAGFAAVVPDLYRGQVAREPDEAGKLVMALNWGQAIKDIQGAVNFLSAQPYVRPKKIGVTGFCVGGGLAMSMSYMGSDVGAVVVFYGGRVDPTDEELQRVSAPLLGLYGEDDPGIPPERISRWRKKLNEYGKTNLFAVYPGAPHAFFNEERPSYRPDAAQDAWERAVTWFKEYLR